jgi:hypothetical protein
MEDTRRLLPVVEFDNKDFFVDTDNREFRDVNDADSDRKGAEWKIVLGSWIKSPCGVSNQWLSKHQITGHRFKPWCPEFL